MSPSHSPQNKWFITVTVMSAAIMSALDTSIVNVALPYMRGNLGASVEEITWVATAYILANVIMMPIIAMLSTRFGRRNVFLVTVTMFVASSMLCGLAWSLGSIIAAVPARGGLRPDLCRALHGGAFAHRAAAHDGGDRPL